LGFTNLRNFFHFYFGTRYENRWFLGTPPTVIRPKIAMNSDPWETTLLECDSEVGLIKFLTSRAQFMLITRNVKVTITEILVYLYKRQSNLNRFQHIITTPIFIKIIRLKVRVRNRIASSCHLLSCCTRIISGENCSQ